jgi:hypothetical protein
MRINQRESKKIRWVVGEGWHSLTHLIRGKHLSFGADIIRHKTKDAKKAPITKPKIKTRIIKGSWNIFVP